MAFPVGDDFSRIPQFVRIRLHGSPVEEELLLMEVVLPEVEFVFYQVDVPGSRRRSIQLMRKQDMMGHGGEKRFGSICSTRLQAYMEI